MNNFTDQEVLNFLHQQEQNFINTARGSGFQAKLARLELEKLNSLTKEERFETGLKSLSKVHLLSV